MRTMNKLMLGLAFPAMLVAGQSAFAAVITQWSYENEVGFTNNTGTAITQDTFNTQANFAIGGAPANPASGLATTLSWGTAQTALGKSRFRLSDTGGVNTSGKLPVPR